MPPPATRSVESPESHADAARYAHASVPVSSPPRDGTWRTLVRHQLGAIVATAIDFGTMIACVEWAGLAPVAATAIGATLGGTTNFAMSRRWIFRRHSGALSGQALRYALVSAGGAAWNALGEHVVHDRAHIQYILARGMVSVVVSLLWNFPMQREFVFHEGKAR